MLYYFHFQYRLAFAIYLLDIMVFIFNIRYGAQLMVLLGTLMIMACGAYGLIILNEPHIRLPWSAADCHPNPSQNEWCALAMEPSFGWSFYLVLFTGLAVFFTGGILYFLDFFFPRYTAPLFHHNIIEEDEEFLEVNFEMVIVFYFCFRRILVVMKMLNIVLNQVGVVIVDELLVVDEPLVIEALPS